MVSDSSTDIIEQLVEEHKTLMALIPLQEVSVRATADASFAKTLMVSAASYFETRVTDSVLDVFSETTNKAQPLVEFVRNKAVERRYHDWFDWTKRNANRFIEAFGNDFKEYMDVWIKMHQEAIRAFMEIGSFRNQLVHKNFASIPLDKTVDEIIDMYQKALGFVDEFPDELKNYLELSKEALAE